MGKKERWKPINGYRGIYKISNRGKIRSLKRRTKWGNGRIRSTKKNITLRHCIRKGYHYVRLYKDGKGTEFLVHRLVAIHFIKNPLGKKEVNHKFGKKKDNRMSQLEWMTPLENAIHALRTGLRKHIPPQLGIKGENNWKSRPVNQLTLNGKIIKRFGGAAEAQRFTGCDSSGIIKCAKGKLRQTGGYKWEYTKRLKKYKKKTRKQILRDYNNKKTAT